MTEHERRIPATETEAIPRTNEPARRRGGAETLLSQLRDLRMGRAPEGLIFEQRAALERIDAALEAYRSFFYPPGSHQ